MSAVDDRHDVFVAEYIKTWSPSKAYKKAYPDANPDSCRSAGSRLLADVSIREKISAYMAEVGMSAEETIARLTKIGRKGDSKNTLRALELLGKANALFQERIVNETKRMTWKEFIEADADPEETGEQPRDVRQEVPESAEQG